MASSTTIDSRRTDSIGLAVDCSHCARRFAAAKTAVSCQSELMRTLRKTGKAKGIALSGYGTEEDVRASKEAGYAAHVRI
jgi:hypothetical protein